jgi:hypothetical protein
VPYVSHAVLQGALTALPLRCLWAVWQALTHLLLPGRRSHQAGSSSSSRPSLLPGAQLYDVLCALLMLGAVVVLNHIKPGVLYYWMKDITSEFLKIQVLFTALEILDKVRCTSATAQLRYSRAGMHACGTASQQRSRCHKLLHA